MNESVFGFEKDVIFMNEALKKAHEAYELGEVPVGAIVVDEFGKIIGDGYNLVERTFFQGAHAEVRAIAKAGQQRMDWRFDECWLYVTLEPCLMCAGCILLSRFKGIVYGASSPQMGALYTVLISSVYNKNNFLVVKGIQEDRAKNLLKDFFHMQRISKEETHEKYANSERDTHKHP